MKDLKTIVKNSMQDIITWRRTIHQNPELSDEEKETSEYIAGILSSLNIPFERQKNNYGIVGKISGKQKGKTIALRADMDALPLTEENSLEYCSNNAGKMHACGHDAHMAILLGAAKVLKEVEEEVKGTVLLVFQPAEEKSPVGGSRRMMESGALEDIDQIFGLHVWPEVKAGILAFKKGPTMAASDHFYVKIQGKASHAAEPHRGIDAMNAAANWIVGIQNIIARNIDPMDNAVITIGTCQAGVRYNVVAEEVKMEGTCRTFNPKVRDFIEKKLEDTLKGIDMMFGTKSSLDYQRGYCALINNAESIEFAKATATKYLGEEAVLEVEHPSMCAEDFAFYLNEHPGAFIWLGTGQEGSQSLHHPKFNIDENILETGSLFLSALAFDFLNS